MARALSLARPFDLSKTLLRQAGCLPAATIIARERNSIFMMCSPRYKSGLKMPYNDGLISLLGRLSWLLIPHSRSLQT